MELRLAFNQTKVTRILSVLNTTSFQYISSLFNSTDSFLENLIMEEGVKRELYLLKYFENKPTNAPFSLQIAVKPFIIKETARNISAKDLVSCIECYSKGEVSIPNNRLDFLLIYFAKSGNVTGVEAVQLYIKTHNFQHFQLQSEYRHYLAEALFINGKVEDSLKQFFSAYSNIHIRDKVKIMLVYLLPLLCTKHSDTILRKAVDKIEKFALEQEDNIILGSLWKSLFMSNWFSDQQVAKELMERNIYLVQIIQWMIPAIGKEFLKEHKIDDFYRLIELTLKYELKNFECSLLRLLFDYYYIHQNIERCSAVVKYVSTNPKLELSKDQQRKYVSLLLKVKDSINAKLIIRNPQNMQYKF